MKKLIIILLSLLCLFVAGCTSSAEKEAERLHKDYALTTKAMWNDEFIPKLQNIFKVKPNTDGQDKEAAILAEQYKPKMLELDKKLQGEKVQKPNEHLLELQKQQVQNSIRFLDTIALLKDKSKLNMQNWQNDFNLVSLAIFNTKLEYNNEYAKITTGKDTYELTLANFQKIHQGDTYQKVAETFKMPGVITGSSSSQLSYGQHTLDTYKWIYNNRKVEIIFENGKAEIISQHNLQ